MIAASPSALLFGLAACVGLMLLVWLLSLARRDASIVDTFWGIGFVGLAWLYRSLGEAPSARALLVALLVTVWGTRLASYIFVRNRAEGEDYRYRAMRERHGPRFWWISLFTVFLLQAVVMWIVSWPLLAATGAAAGPTRWSWLDGAGLALFVVGFAFEAVGDWQLARFRADPHRRGHVLDTGLWRYTRHPNYFGDAVVWWGLFGFAAAVGAWWSIVGPALMTLLLMRVSGVTLLEQRLRETKPKYRDYVARTSAFFPWPPRESPRR